MSARLLSWFPETISTFVTRADSWLEEIRISLLSCQLVLGTLCFRSPKISSLSGIIMSRYPFRRARIFLVWLGMDTPPSQSSCPGPGGGRADEKLSFPSARGEGRQEGWGSRGASEEEEGRRGARSRQSAVNPAAL
ncbi:MAG: hypothetical protein IPI63_11850 [Methanothrix sp.]|uniref:hypothetical protein n=1 Tax=Methanothrix sp. TaxID=90426 RepID=UPI0025EAF041|nr:hypothetical protein [Methanothrix sp.]MBK7387353.1 hypothetical protein [Methanothrix sp.]